jgi:hypothetical protein
LEDQTHTKPHEFALIPTLQQEHPRNKGKEQKNFNEINDLDAKNQQNRREKVLMNQRPAKGSGSEQ